MSLIKAAKSFAQLSAAEIAIGQAIRRNGVPNDCSITGLYSGSPGLKWIHWASGGFSPTCMSKEEQQPSFEQAYESAALDPKLAAFANEILRAKREVLLYVQTLRDRAISSPKHLSFAIYLDAVVKGHLLRIDPFTTNLRGDLGEELSATKEALAYISTRWVASRWLLKFPESQNAREVLNWSIYSNRVTQIALLKEIVPSVKRLQDLALERVDIPIDDDERSFG